MPTSHRLNVATTGTPPVNKPTVGLSGTVIVMGTSITINSNSIADLKTNGIVFSLPSPITLGSPQEFVTWVNATFGTTLDLTTIGTEIPDFLQAAWTAVINGTLTITVLNINTKAKTYALGLTYTLATPVEIIPGTDILELAGLGLSVSYGS